MQQEQVQPKVILRHIAAMLLTAYLSVVILFYFLAGEQLHLRNSRGNIDLLPAESGTVELTAGSVVEQHFIAKIQRLEQVSVQWGTYYRQNTGTVQMELWDLQSQQLLLSQTFDAEAVADGGLTTLTAEQPMEDLYLRPLALRITSSDGQMGTSISPLMSLQKRQGTEEPSELWINDTFTEGTLCFSARGTDYIWTGLHYWEFAGVGFLLLILLFAAILFRVKKGKRSYIINAIIAVQKYRFLIRQLVARDFKTKYKRSVLGVFWSFLNPLLTMLVQYFVFSTIFKNDIPNFAAYLIIGTVMFNFFSEACGMTLTSILGNAGLITKVYMPKYIYPLTRTMSSTVNLVISMLPLLLVCLATGTRLQKSAVLSLYFFACLAVFCLGLGMLLATSMVFFRDTQFLWNVLNMMWMYATPIFYPESILSENFQFVLKLNPLYHFLKSARMCILDGISPEPVIYFQCLLIAMGMLLAGAFIFNREQNKFLLYL